MILQRKYIYIQKVIVNDNTKQILVYIHKVIVNDMTKHFNTCTVLATCFKLVRVL